MTDNPSTASRFSGIDIARFLFACLIPMLHIPFSNPITSFIQQYVSRLGVPFFFAASGMFLTMSIHKYGYKRAWLRFVKRIGKLLLVWLLLYSPLLLYSRQLDLQYLLFKTPAYLWYLTALLSASVFFCFIQNRTILYFVSALLYFLGTLFGETYRSNVGGGTGV